VPVLLLGLDNTLLDRERAFRTWAGEFLRRVGAPPSDLDWLVSMDADGLTSRWDVAEAIRDRYRLKAAAIDIVESLRDGLIENLRLDPLVACAVSIAGNAGFVPVVVSNGETLLQEAKIRRTGLDRYLADWVISEEVGVSKPNPRIFAIAAERVRRRLDGAWMVGDCPETDIEGAAALGLRSVWLHRGRQWSEPRYMPTYSAGGPIEALAAVMDFR
jgi:putative hydrolase of the HAD superfamily